MKFVFNILYVFLAIFSFGQSEEIHYNISKSSGLPSNDTYDIEFDGKGRILIATNKGVFRYDGSNYESIVDTVNRSNEIYLFFKVDSKIFGLSKENIVEIKDERNDVIIGALNKPYKKIKELEPSASFRDVLFKGDSITFLQTSSSMFVFSINIKNERLGYRVIPKSKLVREVEKLSNTSSLHLLGVSKERSLGAHLLSFKGRIFKGDFSGVGRVNEVVLNSKESIFSFGKYYFFLDNGVLKNVDSLSSDIICSKKEGDFLYFGTWKSGLIKIDLKKKSKTSYLQNLTCGNLVFDSKGKLWVTTLEGGVFRVNETVTVLDKKKDFYSIDVVEDTLFVSTYGNSINKWLTSGSLVDSYQLNSMVKFHKLDNNFSLNRIKEFERKNVGVVFTLKEKNFYVFSSGSFFDSNDKAILYEKNSHASELCVINDSTISTLYDNNKMGNYSVVDDSVYITLLRDKYKSFDYFNGLYVLGGGNEVSITPDFLHYQLLKVGSNEKIQNVRFDEEGNVWCLTKSHLYVFKKNNGNYEIAASSKGLFNRELKDFDLNQEFVFIISSEELLRLDRKSFLKNESFEMNLDYHFNLDEIKNSTLHINFVDFGFNSNKRTFEYDINGLTYQSNDENTKLEGLRYGENIFTLSVLISNGVWRKMQPQKIFIPKPIWLRWYFWAIVGLTFIGIILFTFYSTSKLIKKRKNREIEKLKLEAKALKAQMNPHFAFNSLNSAMYFMIEGNKDKAINYLSKFSRLMRMSLDHSNVELVPIEEDLKHLRLYLEIESTRFEDNFTYEIDVDKEVDVTKIKIPPMLIQPLTENSIWHGLQTKKGIRKLNINIYLNKSYLTIEVDDNGVGLKAKMERDKKTSFGMNNTKKRIQLFNKRKDENDFEIIEKYDDLGDKSGLKIRFLLNIASQI